MQVYNVYCNDEQAWLSTTSTDPTTVPTLCPNDDTHTIDSRKTVLIRDVPSVFINSKSYESTQGYYMMRGGRLQIDAASNATTTFDMPFATPVCLYGFNAQVTSSNTGDRFELVMNPDTIIGVLVADAAVGSTEFFVSNTVAQYMKPGFSMSLMDPGTGAKTTVGDVVTVNMYTDDITVGTNSATTSAFPAGTYVLLTLYVARDIYMPSTTTTSIGYGTMAGKPVPMGTLARILYHNDTGGEKAFHWMLEYTY
jgi:hypothetical protein